MSADRLILMAALLLLAACGSDETCSTYSFEECRVVDGMERQCRTVEEQQCVDGDPYYYGPWVTVCFFPYCY